MEGKTQETASAMAGMSERSAREWQCGLASQVRTLQQRLQDWRALHGPEQEVYFPQEHPPGREAQMDFTHCNSLGVSIGSQPKAIAS